MSIAEQNYNAARKELTGKFEDNFSIIEKDKGGTNKFIVEYKKTGERFYMVIVEPPEVNRAHGIEHKKALKIINFMEKLSECLGTDYFTKRLDRGKEKEEEIPYPGVEVINSEFVGGIRDRTEEQNLINTGISKPLDKGVLDINGVKKAYYIIKVPNNEIFSHKDGFEFPADVAYTQARAFTGITKAISMCFGNSFTRFLGKSDPYDPAHQLVKLNEILKDDEKLINVGLGLRKEELGSKNLYQIGKEIILSDKTESKDLLESKTKKNRNKVISIALESIKEQEKETLLASGKKEIEEAIGNISEINKHYKKIGNQLTKGWVHGDPWYDNVSKILKNFALRVFDIEESGRGYLAMDIALAVSAREGANKDGKLNDIGKAYIRGADEVTLVDKKFGKFFHLLHIHYEG